MLFFFFSFFFIHLYLSLTTVLLWIPHNVLFVTLHINSIHFHKVYPSSLLSSHTPQLHPYYYNYLTRNPHRFSKNIHLFPALSFFFPSICTEPPPPPPHMPSHSLCRNVISCLPLVVTHYSKNAHVIISMLNASLLPVFLLKSIKIKINRV